MGQDRRLSDVANLLKTSPADVLDRVKSLSDERRTLTNEVAQLRRELAMGGKSNSAEIIEINGIRLIVKVMQGVSGKDLPSLIDEMKSQIGSGAVVLVAEAGGKPAVAAGVTADLTARISAVTLVQAAVAALGGKGGGGRPDMAQGGGNDMSQVEAAFAAVYAALGA
jgi:alanyl-tRNA synthetase